MLDSSLPVCLRNFHYRIQNALITAQPACRPANFDLATYWEQSKVDFKAGLPTYYATLRVAPAAVERLNSGAACRSHQWISRFLPSTPMKLFFEPLPTGNCK